MNRRFLAALIYGVPVLSGTVLAVIHREPVLVLLGIVGALAIAVGRRIHSARQKTRIKGGRFVEGRWIDMPDPRERALLGGMGGMGAAGDGEDDLVYMAVDAALAAADEVAPKVRQALKERAGETKR